jgi:hypothetical protein
VFYCLTSSGLVRPSKVYEYEKGVRYCQSSRDDHCPIVEPRYADAHDEHEDKFNPSPPPDQDDLMGQHYSW